MPIFCMFFHFSPCIKPQLDIYLNLYMKFLAYWHKN